MQRLSSIIRQNYHHTAPPRPATVPSHLKRIPMHSKSVTQLASSPSRRPPCGQATRLWSQRKNPLSSPHFSHPLIMTKKNTPSDVLHNSHTPASAPSTTASLLSAQSSRLHCSPIELTHPAHSHSQHHHNNNNNNNNNNIPSPASKTFSAYTSSSQGAQTSKSRPSNNNNLKNLQEKASIPGVQNIIAVASAKGGVGKSTVAVNLALALSQIGKNVGLLDADVYGPSAPILLNLENSELRTNSESGKIMPLINYGIQAMSVGFIVSKNSPIVWRGPMLNQYLNEMLFKTQWGPDLDYLIIDFPPGTGDAQLSIAQRVRLTGAVIVSTPQDLALADTVRGINMFHLLQVGILGIVENMAFHQCENCGAIDHIFGQGGVKETATQMGLPFLGAIPLDKLIRETSDSGAPVVVSNPSSPSTKAYFNIAHNLLNNVATGTRPPPEVIVE